MASAMVWKVQRRNSQQRLTIAKPTAWTTAVDVPTDDSFATFLAREAPVIVDQLVEVRLCANATFADTTMTIEVQEELHKTGALATLLRTPGLPPFYLFTVREQCVPEQPLEPAQPPMLRSFFNVLRNGPENEVLSLPERRTESSRRCIDITYKSHGPSTLLRRPTSSVVSCSGTSICTHPAVVSP
jgi:hypothetical protein